MKPGEVAARFDRGKRRAAHITSAAAITLSVILLGGCEQNAFVPPPPPSVDVAVPVQRTVTRYLEATGNTAPVKSVDLVARVQGVLQAINYQDGAFVKEGTTLFTIEPETYKLKLDQAQAAEAGSQASLKQALTRLQAAVGSGAATGGFAVYPRPVHIQSRQRPGQPAAGASQHQDRGGQFRLHQRRCAVRRHCQRASRVGRRTGRRVLRRPSSPPSCNSIRSM